MARTSHHSLHDDVTGFHECAVHEVRARVEGRGALMLHGPAVGFPGGYQVFDSLWKEDEEGSRGDQGGPSPPTSWNTPRCLLMWHLASCHPFWAFC